MTVPLTFARAVHFGSCLLLESVFAVLFLVIQPAWGRSGEETSVERGEIQQRFRRLLWICLLLAFVSGFFWFWLAIAGMSGTGLWEALQPSLFWMVLWQTPPGHVWLARGGIAIGLAIFCHLSPREPQVAKAPSPRSIFCAILGMLLVASLAWLGHAGAGEGPNQNLQLTGDVVHLIAAGMWPGGLVPLAIFLGCYLGKKPNSDSLLAASIATRKFSAFSLVAVAMLVASGIVNSWCLVGNLHSLLATDYGRLLLAKLALFTAMIGIGAWNLFLAKRRLPMAEATAGMESPSAALKIVARNVLIEISLGTLVLIIVGLLGIMPPAIHS